ncbi:MAG TPA: TolC family protein [Thermoanaerobaculales bacterium]|nr:TolC family protein [Thermoanaerobaculales bacterium]HPA82031.1 TolC family protein [Thermoanaerobaculales bacterium]HQL29456.1 TolC family protein [Thermoanaerobaculales bacterium]HQN95101.1 TolC family protein [Thermoanaerobaculales bacterium]HQP43419.1 TolC family protein [Thermoanaerobaculales bacterium]
MPRTPTLAPAAAGIALFIGLLPGALHAQAQEQGSTLPGLVRTAIATHEDVARADSQIRRAQADIKLTSSALLPRLDLNGSWTRYQDELSIELTPGEKFVIQPSTDWGWSADLSQTLFYGLRDWRARDIAKLSRDIAQLQRTTVVNDLTLAVAAAFYTAVAAEQRVAVERVALEASSTQLKVAERRFEVGEVPVADVARWRAEVAAGRQRLVVAEGEAEIARRRLARAAGVPEVGSLIAPGPVPVPPGEDESLRLQAMDGRLEMATLRNQLEAAGLWVRVERGGWLPELDANVQYLQQKSEFPSDSWLSLSLNLRVPVYDGGLTAARVARAKEDLREVELLEVEVRKAISDQVDSAAVTYRAATAALEAAGERREASREAYRQVDRAYRVGEATALDLLDATSEATDAENTLIIAKAQREYQAIALRHAIGLPPLPDLDPSSLLNEEATP